MQKARKNERTALGLVAVTLLEKAHLLFVTYGANEARRFLSSSRCAFTLLNHECKERAACLSNHNR